MKEAMFWVKKGNAVQCNICPRNCVIKEGELGFCHARKNVEGTLYALSYGKVVNGLSIDPIEKKPLYHFLPGTPVLSFGTAGCNLRCKHCQNYSISQISPDDAFNVEMTPEQIVEEAIQEGCTTIAYTYTEPTIFYEFTLDTAKLAKEKGLKNVLVSNGFINPEPLKELIPFIDAANIDFKGNDSFYRRVAEAWIAPVQETLKTLKEANVWIEITTLIIPEENDDDEQLEEMMEWVKNNLGLSVPWHFTGFYPCYKFEDHKPTSEKRLLEIREKAIKKGFNYVYAGNLINEETNSTYHPETKEPAIKRSGFNVVGKGNLEGVDGIWR